MAYAPQQAQGYPPQPPGRQPQTAGDPNNTGSSPTTLQQLTEALTSIQKGIEIVGEGIGSTSKKVNHGVLFQKTILQVLLTMAELQGIPPEQLVKQVKVGDPQAVEKFLTALSEQPGKG